MVKIGERIKSLHRLLRFSPKRRLWVPLGILVALLVALPVSIWGLLNADFELRKKAQEESTIVACVPPPACLYTYPRCRLNIPPPPGGWCPTPLPTAEPTSIVLPPPTACSTLGRPCGFGFSGQPLGYCCPDLICETYPDGGICREAPYPTPIEVPLCVQSTIPPAGGFAPLTVTLHGGGSAGTTSGIDGYQWDFEGDGTWDTGVSIDPVTHTYTLAGTYYPKYRVHATNNQWSDVCEYAFPIVVNQPPSCNQNDKGNMTVDYYTRPDGMPGLKVAVTSKTNYQNGALKITQLGTGAYYFMGDKPSFEQKDSLYTWTWNIVKPAVDSFRIEFYINQTQSANGEECGSWITSQPHSFRLKFMGVTSRPVDDSGKQIRFYATSLDGGPALASAGNKDAVEVTVDDNGVYHGTIILNGDYFSHHYRLRIKGPKHLQEVFSDVVFNSSVELDLTAKPLRPGDINSDGVLNSVDLQETNKRIFSTNPDDIALVDVNFDKKINIADRTLILNTLSVQYDQE